jgi:exopolyphosphatase/guanosine-5'-triphosphate,3'-diphosphate pyrophosphatase
MLFDRVAAGWKLDDDMRRMLAWAARLHELGLAIAHSQYQLHGAYVLQHSDIAGFSLQEQQVLAALVRSHRRKVPGKAFDAIPDRLLADTKRVAALLRLAVLLHRSHEEAELPELRAAAKRDQLSLTLPARWLEQRPLLRADLDGEPADMAGLGIALEIRAD